MFGYITANISGMNSTQQTRYRAWYCGLCRTLSQRHGPLSRMTVNYDMTFLVMLLSSVYTREPETGAERCIAHPLKKHDYFHNEYSEYSADMNVLLAYHNLMDNWHDDRSVLSLAEAKLFSKAAERVSAEYPLQSQAVLNGLSALSDAEKTGEINPDVPAEAFGGIMGELFAVHDDRFAPDLRTFGRALGRFIYIMDACMDFDSDLKHMRYNPMISMTHADFEPTLTMLAAECTTAFDRLPVDSDRDIMENILYSGMWARFNSLRSGRKIKNKKEALSEQ